MNTLGFDAGHNNLTDLIVRPRQCLLGPCGSTLSIVPECEEYSVKVVMNVVSMINENALHPACPALVIFYYFSIFFLPLFRSNSLIINESSILFAWAGTMNMFDIDRGEQLEREARNAGRTLTPWVHRILTFCARP